MELDREFGLGLGRDLGSGRGVMNNLDLTSIYWLFDETVILPTLPRRRLMRKSILHVQRLTSEVNESIIGISQLISIELANEKS